jgi:hypothetical protein
MGMSDYLIGPNCQAAPMAIIAMMALVGFIGTVQGLVALWSAVRVQEEIGTGPVEEVARPLVLRLTIFVAMLCSCLPMLILLDHLSHRKKVRNLEESLRTRAAMRPYRAGTGGSNALPAHPAPPIRPIPRSHYVPSVNDRVSANSYEMRSPRGQQDVEAGYR